MTRHVLLLLLLLLSPVALLSTLLLGGSDSSALSLVAPVRAEEGDPLDDDEAEEEDEDEDYEFEDEDEDEDDYDDDLGGITANQDASMNIVFPGHTGITKSFHAGSKIDAFVGFQNSGKGPFVVNMISGAFRHPQDASVIMQNFSGIIYNSTVAPGEERSFSYAFMPSKNIYAGTDLILDVAVTYSTAEGNFFMDAAYNQTVTISDPEDYMDNKTWLAAAAATLIAVFFAYQKLLKASAKSYETKATSRTETGTEKDFDASFLPRELQ